MWTWLKNGLLLLKNLNPQMNNRRAEKIFWISFALASPLVPILFYFWGNWYSFFHSYSLGMVMGIIGYVYFFNVLIIGSKIRYFDGVFGHDRVLLFHGYMALSAMLAVVAHFLFKQIYGFDLTIQTLLGITASALFLIVIILTLLFMVNIIPFWPGLMRTLKKEVEKRLRTDYSKVKFFHNCSSVAAFLAAIHLLLASSTQENNWRIIILSVWAFTGVSFYFYHKFVRIVVSAKLLTVTDVKKLSSDIVEIRMHHNKDTAIKYRAGQFGYFRIISKMFSKEEHPFTISSQPGTDELSITVKNLGDYTSKLHNVQAGTTVHFDGPYGVFTPKQDGKHHIFIAGGIGITPFHSIISEWDFADIKTPLTLIWSTRTAEEMVYRDFFTRIESKNSMFMFVPIITRSAKSITGGRRIDKTVLDPLLRKKEIKNTAVYVCGPDLMRKSVIKDLKSSGIVSKNIHWEKFSF